MKLSQILKLSSVDFKRLSVAEKIQAVEYLQKVANKRIDRLHESGLTAVSSALHSRSGRKFTGKHMNASRASKMEKAYQSRRNDAKKSGLSLSNVKKNKKLEKLEERLTDEFSEGKSFLSSPSSTLKGANRTFNRASKDFASFDTLMNMSKAQQNKFWEAYNRLKDYDPSLLKSQDYMKRREQLFNIMLKNPDGKRNRLRNIDEALSLMENKMREDYTKAYSAKYGDSPMNKPMFDDDWE